MMEHAPIFILLVPLFSIPLIVGLGLWRRDLAYPLSVVSAILYGGVVLRALSYYWAKGAVQYSLAGWSAPFGIELVLDGLSIFMLLVLAGIFILGSIYAGSVVRLELPTNRVLFFALSQVLLLGLSGMVLTGDLFNLYVFLEISSLAAYALVAIGHPNAALAALRYLLLGSVGASFYLLGIGFVYAMCGSLNMADVAVRIQPILYSAPVIIALLLMVVGFMVKVAIFPLHSWLPDAYAYASSGATALIPPLMTKVNAYVLIRILYFVFRSPEYGPEHGLGYGLKYGMAPHDALFEFIGWMSVLSICFGAGMAMAQQNTKRLFAYSSISQVGYIGIGIAMQHPLALMGALLHVFNHAVMKACLFMVVGRVSVKEGGVALNNFAGLGKRYPWVMGAFSLSLLSMVGLPPLGGFFSKWYLVLGAIGSGHWVWAAIILGSSLLTAVYAFRLIERIYTCPREEQGQSMPVSHEEPSVPALKGRRFFNIASLTPIAVLAAGVILLGLFNVHLLDRLIRPALPPGFQVKHSLSDSSMDSLKVGGD